MKTKNKYSLPSKYWLIIVIVICVILMGVERITGGNGPISFIANYTVIPMQKGIGYVERYMTDLSDNFETLQDMKKEKRVCVVSDTMASYYFGSEDPVGQQIIYSGSDGYSYEFTVVGVYEYNAAIFGKQDTTIPEKDRSTTMYIPATTANKLNHSEATNGYTYISVLLKTGADQNQA